MKAPTETHLIKQCLQLLVLRGVFAWRQNTTGIRRTDAKGRQWWAPAALRGVSDILAILPPHGRLLAVECKVGENMPSLEQSVFLSDVRAHGGEAVCVWSVVELETFLDLLEISR